MPTNVATNGTNENIFWGLNILLAEDNVVNQKVACQQLKKFGTEVDVVCDGQQCLKVLSMNRDKYDLILMDVQVIIILHIQMFSTLQIDLVGTLQLFWLQFHFHKIYIYIYIIYTHTHIYYLKKGYCFGVFTIVSLRRL